MEINELISRAYDNAKQKGLCTGTREVGTDLMTIVGELSEALDAHRKGDLSQFEEEVADAAIALGTFCGKWGINLETKIENKLELLQYRPFRHGKIY